jgi:murein L,D-transpeptidase YcbB/YkuD
MKNEQKILIVVLVVVLLLLILFRDKVAAMFAKKTETAPSTTGKTTAVPTPAPVNYDKNLSKGLYNDASVALLQQWLGIKADGDFGPATEAALLAKKGVTQITLNQYQQLADVQHTEDSTDEGIGTNFSSTFSTFFNSGTSSAVNWLSSL